MIRFLGWMTVICLGLYFGIIQRLLVIVATAMIAFAGFLSMIFGAGTLLIS